MRIPNKSRTVLRFAQDIVLYRVTQSIVNYRPVEVINLPFMIKAVIKPTQKNIVKGDMTYSLRYIHIVSLNEIKVNDIIEYKNTKYRCNSLPPDYSDYGFYKADLEEIKE